MQLYYTAKFLREYRKLPLQIKRKAEARESTFRKDPFTSILKTHKLQGELADFWSFSIDFRYRIIFQFNADKTVIIFHSIGNHKIYA